MPAATLASKGQITIPQAVRVALGLHAGTWVDFVPVADGGLLSVNATNQAPTIALFVEQQFHH